MAPTYEVLGLFLLALMMYRTFLMAFRLSRSLEGHWALGVTVAVRVRMGVILGSPGLRLKSKMPILRL